MEEIDFRIIVIDDNPAIHQDFIKILTTRPANSLDDISQKIFGSEVSKDSLLPDFKIDTASQGEEGINAVKKAKEEGKPYALAFVDIRMPPGLDGIETIKRIWEIDQDVQAVICTAYSDYSWEETVEQLGRNDNLLILKKPFDTLTVRQLACALTKKWQLMQTSRRFTNYLKKEINEKTNSLKTSLSLVKATLESSDDGIIVIDKDGNISDYNHKFLYMWGIKKEFLTSHSGIDLIDHISNQMVNTDEFLKWCNALIRKDNTDRLEMIHLTNGQIFDCYAQPQKINDKVIGKVLNFRDITTRAKLEMQLQHQATHDALTGLPNRIYVLEEMHVAIKHAIKFNLMVAILYIDLDRFKLINDSLTHAAGDQLLCEVATRLTNCVRTNDTVARLGGDEFLIVLSNIKSQKDVEKMSKKILALLNEPIKLTEREVIPSASIGISFFPLDGKIADVLVRNADVAMYSAKENGGNSYQFYSSEMHIISLDKLDKETELHNALKNNEFVLYYQPQYDLLKEKLIAAEALLRWRHPNEGLLMPLDFIPLAEETGLIVPIGEWVIRTACAQAKAWQEAGLADLRVAVNITAQQLRQENIVNVIDTILKETKLQPKYLELELTENTIVSSSEILDSIGNLKKLGVLITIDDFGTGYSSLSYLKKLPLDRLKIDRSFIEHIKYATDDDVIIRSIITLAKNLHLEVLAEGVETQTQLNFLKQQQCDEIQGFYLSKPLSTKDFEQLLHNKTMDFSDVLQEKINL